MFWMQTIIMTLKLHECASHEPGEDLQKDFEIGQLEHKLMATQEDILEQAANLKIERDEDFRIVNNIWSSETDFMSKEELSDVDKMTMSLHKYFSQRVFNQ